MCGGEPPANETTAEPTFEPVHRPTIEPTAAPSDCGFVAQCRINGARAADVDEAAWMAFRELCAGWMNISSDDVSLSAAIDFSESSHGSRKLVIYISDALHIRVEMFGVKLNVTVMTAFDSSSYATPDEMVAALIEMFRSGLMDPETPSDWLKLAGEMGSSLGNDTDISFADPEILSTISESDESPTATATQPPSASPIDPEVSSSENSEDVSSKNMMIITTVAVTVGTVMLCLLAMLVWWCTHPTEKKNNESKFANVSPVANVPPPAVVPPTNYSQPNAV